MKIKNLKTTEVKFSRNNALQLARALTEYENTGLEQIVEIVEWKGKNLDKKEVYIITVGYDDSEEGVETEYNDSTEGEEE